MNEISILRDVLSIFKDQTPPKFTPGDKVKCTMKDSGFTDKTARVKSVEYRRYDGYYYWIVPVPGNGQQGWVPEYVLEPLPNHKFNEGDKVIYHNHKVYEVLKLSRSACAETYWEDVYTVKDSNGWIVDIHENSLELYSDPESL